LRLTKKRGHSLLTRASKGGMGPSRRSRKVTETDSSREKFKGKKEIEFKSQRYSHINNEGDKLNKKV